MFVQYGIYKHKNCLDAAILVIKRQFANHRKIVLRIEWMVRSAVGGWRSTRIRETIEVRPEDKGNWFLVDRA